MENRAVGRKVKLGEGFEERVGAGLEVEEMEELFIR